MTSEIKSNVLKAGGVRGRARETEQPLAQPHPCPLLLCSCDTGGRGKALDKESGRTGSSPGSTNSVTGARSLPLLGPHVYREKAGLTGESVILPAWTSGMLS